jgi:hypothetical protein
MTFSLLKKKMQIERSRLVEKLDNSSGLKKMNTWQRLAWIEWGRSIFKCIPNRDFL